MTDRSGTDSEAVANGAELTPPIALVCKGGEVLIFRTFEDAARYVEPIDVEAGEYLWFDSTGARINVEAHDGSRNFWGGRSVLPRIIGLERGSEYRDQLRSLLRDELHAKGVDDLSRLFLSKLARSGFHR